ncbi:S-layer-like y domain-containing protein [Filibacter tadaridae]|uniref:Periplasmic pH-dependent serine endoprotease DegQ n=1 Tax=Filibacter tadaridae TaxID=2483811 RepID=A0A3P5X152_9BACL|nr:S-layer homology domain-containing protein [Filibacter tadaridae]VDC25030.1 Periplasmic pH-dependent serine endoprotease DegQ precursor [Filibacter tadaridae]
MKRFLSIFIVLGLVFSLVTQVSAASATFKDVPASHPFYKEITFLLDRGVISAKDKYGVNDKVTREEVAVMVSKAVGLNGTQTSTKFKDVPKSNRSSGYINSAVNAGIINGYSDGTFRPKLIVNRGQMAIFLANAFDLKVDSSSNFKDVKPSMASYSAIKKIVQAKITTGYSDNTFRPNDTLTRGQISAFLARAMDSGKVDSEKVYSTKEVVELNDPKVVLIETDTGQGSGVVIANGLIITNHHVIDEATRATVTFNNGAKFEVAGVVESDSKKDIAILKTTKTFTESGVSIRPSSKGLSKGEKVIAIGNPKGLQNTVSEGIISSFRNPEGVSLIQINADIDHGSSDGGLFDVSGKLIGITSSGYDKAYANLNFAVASEEFVPMVNKYINKDFKNINASFAKPNIPEQPTKPTEPTEPNQYPVLGKVALGMTKEQVKNLAGGYFSNETTNTLYFSNANVLGYLADTSYEFQGNKLVAINVFHYVVENQYDLDILEAFFVVMYNEISDVYGRADILDTDWYDDNDGYSLSAYWMNPTHNTLLVVKIMESFDTYGGIRISIS